MSTSARTIFTIGHSNASIEAFLALLGGHAIEVVVDVRSSPSSRHTPHFGRGQLERYLHRAAVRYIFMGSELGGRPSSAGMYDPDGYVRYDLVAASPEFASGIERLVRGAADHRIAIMCGEEDPLSCHRRRLVGRALVDTGVAVSHIRHDGSVDSELEVAEREAKKYPELNQLRMDGTMPWRSIHPVKDRIVKASNS